MQRHRSNLKLQDRERLLGRRPEAEASGVQEARQEARHHLETIQRTLDDAPAETVGKILELVRPAARILDHEAVARESKTDILDVPAERMDQYFPPSDPTAIPTAEQIATVENNLAEMDAHQTDFRRAAREQIGPLLTPGEASARLGVSHATIANWRRRDQLLGVRFDGHQYLYPSWQFVTSPAQGENGVIRHLDQVLRALEDTHPYVKAQFLLAQSPFLGGCRPIDVLLAGSPRQVADVLTLAEHRSEMGS